MPRSPKVARPFRTLALCVCIAVALSSAAILGFSALYDVYWFDAQRRMYVGAERCGVEVLVSNAPGGAAYIRGPSRWGVERNTAYGPSAAGPWVWWPQVRHLSIETSVLVPLWIPFLLFAIPGALVWRSNCIATKRARADRCPKCGYDRHGLAADAKCPECGAVPTK